MHFPKLSRKTVRNLVILLIFIMVITGAIFYWSWISFQGYYLGVMKDLHSPETKAYMRNKINGTYNFIELLNWANQNLNWSKFSTIFSASANPRTGEREMRRIHYRLCICLFGAWIRRQTRCLSAILSIWQRLSRMGRSES